MAFIRRKKVRGYAYYQIVRNYRDGDGKHRQEVLDHLGVHDSIEAALAFRREKIASHLEQAAAISTRVEGARADLQELYTDDLGGIIPSVEEAWDTHESVALELDDWNVDSFFEGGPFYYEILEINLERAAQTIEYYELISQADQEKTLARQWQAKLNHLLNIQETYF